MSLGFLGIHQLSIKKWFFLIEGVFFLLTSPLMGDPLFSIYQDFHARVFSKNMTQVLSLPTKPFIDQAYRNRKYSYQVNFAQALASVKNTIVLLFNRPMETVNRLLYDLLELLSITVESVRPGRSYPRNHKLRKNFYLNYKPIG